MVSGFVVLAFSFRIVEPYFHLVIGLLPLSSHLLPVLFCLDIGLTLELENWNRWHAFDCDWLFRKCRESPFTRILLPSPVRRPRPIIMDIGNGSNVELCKNLLIPAAAIC